MKNILSVITIGSFLLLSCGKKDTGTTVVTPTNLTVNAVVSTDNSGNVAFTASATNASTYDYDFGNGVFQTVPTGIVTYKYPASGTYSVNVIAKSRTGQTISQRTTVTVAVTQSLIFSDEFEANGAPDPSKWGYDIGTGSNGWGNNELQHYTNRLDNAFVSNGTLKIRAIREAFSGSAFTSARILTQNKFSFRYGKVEVRAKLPAGVGTWPAIWMLGNNITTVGWPACGEIDIMEHKGSQLNRIHGTVHHPARFGGNADGGTRDITNATTEFQIYSMEWNALSIKFLVNGNVYHTVANNSSLPFNQNFFLIMNLAMGGTFGGAVESGFSNATMEIDYIRVYQ
ncbi:MAG: family 16 glycosylhydrolase [Sediminibacterium sp.]|jgi:beta-glucanase (GH16 family)